MNKDTLGDRMKDFEAIPKNFLIRRMPVIIRLDGRAFHSFTRRAAIKNGAHEDPFSETMKFCMTHTAKVLCKQVQNVVLAYTQSDEISLLLTDWATFDTQQWFTGNIQKIVSLSASIATLAFNSAYATYESIKDCEDMPMFDARVFNLTREEVCNYFLWRQQDASRNSVNMLAQYHFSHKVLQGKNNSQMQDMLMLEKGVNWNDIDTWKKRGFCVKKAQRNLVHEGENGFTATFVEELGWQPDYEIPIFSQDRQYINKFVMEDENV